MSVVSQENKRVAKNTLFMYFRMLFLTLINLYTVRVTLEILGEVDYGIYNVIASMVTSLGILTGTMTSATQRFFSFSLGKEDFEEYRKLFSLILICFVAISIISISIGEPIGIYCIKNVLNIPANNSYAAHWVFQTSLIVFIASILTIPYTSTIIAHEKVSIFAYVSIIDGILKLGLVYLLLISTTNHLILYGILTAIESLIILSIYAIYVHRNYWYCKIQFIWEKRLFKDLSSYTGWNLFGSISSILCTQGQNILLNIYFGPVINTAKAVGDKISHTVQTFSTNFYIAVTPQIIKSYAKGDFDRYYSLVLKSSRLSYFLLLILAFPIICSMKQILSLWLGEGMVTEWMVGFSCLSILYCLVFSLEQPITQMIRATGHIKNYQIWTGLFTLSYIFLAWSILKLGGSPLSTMETLITVIIIVQVVRIVIVHNQIGLSYKIYATNVVIPILIPTFLAVPIWYIFNLLTTTYSIIYLILITICQMTTIGIIIYLFGLKKEDRLFIYNHIFKRRKVIK